MPVRSTDPKSYHHGDLRRGLIDTARSVLREGAIDNLSLRELARRLNVSSRAPYRHFSSKVALMSAIATVGFTELRTALEAAAANVPRGSELQAQARAYVHFAVRDPSLFRLMFSYRMSDADPDLRAAKLATQALLAVRAEASSSSVDDAPAKALGCWSLVHGLAILILDGLALEGKPEQENDVISRVIDAMLPLQRNLES